MNMTMYDKIVICDCMDKVIAIASELLDCNEIPLSDAARMIKLLDEAMLHTYGSTRSRILRIKNLVSRGTAPTTVVTCTFPIINECKFVQAWIM